MSTETETTGTTSSARLSNPWYRFKRVLERNATFLISAEALAFYVFLYIPIIVVVVTSFNDARIAIAWEGFTTKWYEMLLSGQGTRVVNPDVAWVAFKNSVYVGAVSMAVSTVFGTMLAFVLQRYDFVGKRPFVGLVYMPIIMPSIIMGISALLFFRTIGLQTGLGTTMIAHIAFNISYVSVVVYARLAGFDQTLEEAAKSLGANRLETFRYVTLPSIMPAIVAAALLAFVLSFDDFVITFFVVGTENTLPVFFFGMVRQGIAPGVNVVATLILLVVSAGVVLAMYLGGKEVVV
jgi:spermidine/putrescine transport system permease protein